MAKVRTGAPNCQGRFPELRTAFFNAATEIRNDFGAKWKPVTLSDLEYFIMLAEDKTPINSLIFTDPKDPYFNNRTDTFRGDPLVGDEENKDISLVPFAFEGLRRDLIERISLVRGLQTKITQHIIASRPEGDPSKKLSSDDYDLLLLEVEELLGEGTLKELKSYSPLEVSQALSYIERRDPTITATSMNPVLLDAYARLYVNSDRTKTLDLLSLFHNGSETLEESLGFKMKEVCVPKKKGGSVCLSGYRIQAEFGTGINTAGTMVSSSPYRFEVHKNGDHRKTINGDLIARPCLTVAFYLSHPNTMVVSQVQEMRGGVLPEGTTTGLVAFTVVEQIADAMGFDRVISYSHHTNPVLNLYPDDNTVKMALRSNLDEPLNQLKWTAVRDDKKMPLYFERAK